MKLNDWDLNKLHVFRVVAESASMREAGERLLRTPSAISQSVTTLERGLGFPLFVRSGIRLELTENGRRLLKQVKSSEQELKVLLESVRGEPSLVRGRVALGMPPGYPAVSLGDGLSATLREFQELQLRLRFLSHRQLAQGLLDDSLEMALSFQPLRALGRRIRSMKLREETLILAVPARLRRLSSDQWNEAGSELPVVDYYQKPLLIEGWLRHHRLRQAKTQIRVFGSNLDHVLQMVKGGVGCAVVPRHAVALELSSGALLEHALDRKRPWIVSVWLNATRTPEQFAPASRAIWQALVRP